MHDDRGRAGRCHRLWRWRRRRRLRVSPGAPSARRRDPTTAIQHRVLIPGSVIACCDQQ